ESQGWEDKPGDSSEKILLHGLQTASGTSGSRATFPRHATASTSGLRQPCQLRLGNRHAELCKRCRCAAAIACLIPPAPILDLSSSNLSSRRF
ncbi:hypothetical protein JEQ12_010170, partial [Ovis aries]